MPITSNTDKNEPLSNLAYDWVTIIQHKSEALRAYQDYIRDAQQANSQECVELMQRIYEEDARHVQEATQHLMHVLQGQMGQGQGMQGQGMQGQGMQGKGMQGQSSSQGMQQGQGTQGQSGQGMQQGQSKGQGMQGNNR